MGIDWELLTAHVQTPRSRWEILIRCQLWSNAKIDELIAVRVERPDHLLLDRMHFPEKLALAAALGGLEPEDSGVYRKLNRFRNSLAHDLSAEVEDDHISELYQSLSQGQLGFYKDLESYGNEKGILKRDDEWTRVLKMVGLVLVNWLEIEVDRARDRQAASPAEILVEELVRLRQDST